MTQRARFAPPDTGVIENNVSTESWTFERVWLNAHTDERTRIVVADRPPAECLPSPVRRSNIRFIVESTSVETLFSITPVPGPGLITLNPKP